MESLPSIKDRVDSHNGAEMNKGTYISDKGLGTGIESELLTILKESATRAIEIRQNAMDLVDNLASQEPLDGYYNPLTMATEHPGRSAWMHTHRTWAMASVPVLKAHMQAAEFTIAQAYQNIGAEERVASEMDWDKTWRQGREMYREVNYGMPDDDNSTEASR